MSIATIKRQIKAGNTPITAQLKRLYLGLRCFSCPVLPSLHRSLYHLHHLIGGGVAWITRALYWTPLFQSRLSAPAQGLLLYSGLPQVWGDLDITIGRDCRISGHSSFCGRAGGAEKPVLIIGDNVGISWQTTINVGRQVRLGNNVRIAGRTVLSGYPGHPLDARDRAAGRPDTPDQVGDIVLDDDVWIGSGVFVNAGVHIGARTVVAAGSVVTKDLPPDVLAAGVPARVIRPLNSQRKKKP